MISTYRAMMNRSFSVIHAQYRELPIAFLTLLSPPTTHCWPSTFAM